MTEAKRPPRAMKRVVRLPARRADTSDRRADAPAGAEAGTGELSNRWREAFFAKLAETSNVAAACDHAGISRAAVYSLRRRDSAFCERWMVALAEGYE